MNIKIAAKSTGANHVLLFNQTEDIYNSPIVIKNNILSDVNNGYIIYDYLKVSL
jgi:hypothetical protein